MYCHYHTYHSVTQRYMFVLAILIFIVYIYFTDFFFPFSLSLQHVEDRYYIKPLSKVVADLPSVVSHRKKVYVDFGAKEYDTSVLFFLDWYVHIYITYIDRYSNHAYVETNTPHLLISITFLCIVYVKYVKYMQV